MEVEIKAKIEDFKDLKSKLKKLGATFEESKKQLDTYFVDKNRDSGIIKIGDFITRIRECEKGKFLTYKEITGKWGVWEELETGIDNTEETAKILKRLGLRELFRLNKNRISGKTEKFKFNLDKVEKLGDYIEVELISDNGEKAQEEIKGLFKRLEIEENQLERRGYGELWQIAHGGGIKYDEQK